MHESRHHIWVLALALILLSQFCHAYTVSGIVIDADGQPLAGVIVKISGINGKTVSFTSTDSKGRYKLTCPDGMKDAKCRFSLLGYGPLEITAEKLKANGNVTLKDSDIELKEVTVKAPPIRSSNDTITYDVGSFKSKSDRSIEDVIKRMPGIEVQPNGSIRYNGEPINRFYIEGLDMLGGRYVMATRNISADDIQSVNVYENHQPVRALKNIEYTDRAALNLKLKRKRMLNPSGYATAGIGAGDDEAKWTGELYTMLIAPKTQTFINGKANNFGTGYGAETTSYAGNGAATTSTVASMLTQSPIAMPSLPASRYARNTSAYASLTSGHKFNDYMSLSGYATFITERNRYSSEATTQYLTGDEKSITISETGNAATKASVASGAIKLEYNAPHLYVLDNLTLKGSFKHNEFDISGNAARSVQQSVRLGALNLGNRLNIAFRKGINVVQVKSDIALSNVPKNYLLAINPIADTLIVDQSLKGLSFATAQSTSFSRALRSGSMIGIDVALNTSVDRITPRLTVGNEGKPDTDGRHSGYSITTTAAPFYQLDKGRLLWRTTIPIRLYNIKYRDVAADSSYRHNDVYIDATSSLRYNFPFRVRALLTVRHSYSMGSIRDFLTVPVFTSYRNSSTFGTGQLGINRRLSASLSLNYSNIPDGLFGNILASIGRDVNNRMSSTSISDSDITSTKLNRRSTSRRGELTVSGSKRVDAISTTFNTSIGGAFLTGKSQRNATTMTTRLNTVTIITGIKSSLFADRLVMSPHFNVDISKRSVDNMADKSTMRNYRLSAPISAFPVPIFEIGVSPEYTALQDASGQYHRNLFVNGFARLVKSRFEIELQLHNITDRRLYSVTTFSTFDTYTYNVGLRPIEGIVTVKYRF